jgi:hypothetical protein
MNNIDKQIAEIEAKINDPELCFGTASTMTRVTGYWRPVENFCYGKRQEYADRIEYNPFGNKPNVDKQWVKKLLHGKE